MAIYNEILTKMKCPNCGAAIEVALQAVFGVRDLRQYRVGDRVDWVAGRAFQNGGRPENGEVTLNAYGVCSVCDRDFFVPVAVRSDHIADVVEEDARPGHDVGNLS